MIRFEDLKGQIITKIEKDDDIALFFYTTSKVYKMHHYQDCCESVYIDDIEGNLEDLLKSEILSAEEVSNHEERGEYESATWTFYKLATIKGYVTIKWLGTSNGYYSEAVTFELLEDKKIVLDEGWYL